MNLLTKAVASVVVLCALSSCGPCRNEGVESLADLITDSIGLFNKETKVNVGDVVNIGIGIKNVIESFQECDKTKTAEESTYLLKFLYRADGASDYVEIAQATYTATEIAAGEIFQDQSEFAFMVGGEYKIVAASDFEDDVEERDETNNDKDSEGIEGRSIRDGFVVSNVFLVESTHHQLVRHDVAIPYLRALPKYNLKSFQVRETFTY